MNPRDLKVSEIGSFYVGGRLTRLQGLPERARVSTQGGPIHPIDPNGEIMAGQMYVQFVRLAKPRATAPLLFGTEAG